MTGNYVKISSNTAEIYSAQITSENLKELTDYVEYKEEFLKLFGFGVDGVDYEADVNPAVETDFTQI